MISKTPWHFSCAMVFCCILSVRRKSQKEERTYFVEMTYIFLKNKDELYITT